MAMTHSSPVFHSSSSAAAIAIVKNESQIIFTSFFVCKPRSISGFFTRRRVQATNHFPVKSSNGHPLNAVSPQDGIAGSPFGEEGKDTVGKEGLKDLCNEGKAESTLSITVVGASGDLARRKIFPALFALYYEDFLPENFTVFGYARTKLTDDELRHMISRTLTCRIDKRENCEEKMDQFLKRCFYHSGQYNSEEHFAELDDKLKEKEGEKLSYRLFYLAIPPDMFVDVVRCASLKASSTNGWTRVIVEKPFGRDSESSRELTRSLKQYLSEDQIFRIDHYLGKELVENLSVLRFSNLVFEPLWSRNYIRNVQFIFSEDFGTEGRGGYFDNYGIIRDIMQNHLLQIVALFAMETPVSLDAEDIRNEKVKVLRSMKPLQLEDVVVGQYKGQSKGGKTYPGYTDDPTVPSDSLTPTFAATALFINNARWDGVPFLMKAGKALHTRRAEIRVQFRHVPGNLYRRNFGTDLDKATNELVLRVQPDEAIYLKINNKVPGLGMRLDRSDLNMLFRTRYPREIPDAYERLLLDAVEGERRLFIRSDELDAAWALFTPVLKELEEKRIVPELYPYGSRGPVGAHYLAAKYNVRWGDLDEMVGLSLGEKRFIQGGIAQDLRTDGRKRLTYRPIYIETGVIPQAHGSARVRLGATDVIASVKGELGRPSNLNPDKGKVAIHVDCSPTAAPMFEGRGGEELSAELSLALERCLMGAKTGTGAGIDLSSLIIVEGKICWDLYIDGLVISSDGNLLDALAAAIKAALSNTGIPKAQVAAQVSGDERPEVNISDEDFVQFDTSAVPVIVTLTKVGRHYIVDATSEEESQMSSAVSISINRQGFICGLIKRGGAGLDPSIILDMISVAKHVSEQLIITLDSEIAAAEEEL